MLWGRKDAKKATPAPDVKAKTKAKAKKGKAKIGSTLKGIGPAYQDKYARAGLRVGDVLRPDFEERYAALKEAHLSVLGFTDFDISQLPDLEQTWFASLENLRAFRIEETEYLLNKSLSAGQNVLAEGAQGSLLDIDFGSYPYVTSSSTMAAGACIGLGVAPKHVREVFGVFKAYCTRVGSGPFLTELHDEVGEQIRQTGQEFGSTTGRPRRTGWLDLPALAYTCMLSGVTQLMMMKADVLADREEVKVCNRYLIHGESSDYYPAGPEAADAHPVYDAMPGWEAATTPATYEALPQGLQRYTEHIEHFTGLPITLISNGPDRKDTLLRPLSA
jgi:adenylosuccinate synthase